jgi:hypothetical protein
VPPRGILLGAGETPNGGIGGEELCETVSNLREWEDFEEISIGNVDASGCGPRSEPLPNPMSSRRCSLLWLIVRPSPWQLSFVETR